MPRTQPAELAASRAALASIDAYLRSMPGASGDCVGVFDLDVRLTFMS